MTSVRLKEFEKAHFPARRPWLLIVILVLVAGFFFFRYFGRKPSVEASATRPASESVEQKSPPAVSTPATIAPHPSAAPSTGDTAAPPSSEMQALLARAIGLEQAGSLLQARSLYYDLLDREMNLVMRGEVEARLGKLNVALVLNPSEMPEKVVYVVQSGDSVDRIARKHGVSRLLLERSNRIRDPDRIRPGDMLRVYTGSFRILVSRSQNYLLLYANDRFFKRYVVSTGEFGKTPVGTYTISDHIPEPIWWRPDGKQIPFGDPENVLGTRWMALKATGDTPDVKGYGIHGTMDEKALGQAVSQGCVRMRNEDVEELFDMVPWGTPVVIAE